MRRFTAALFLLGLAVLVAAIYQQMNLVVTPLAGDAINASAGQQVGAGNIVTAVVLASRGFDTLLELTILFTAATAGGPVLGKPRADVRRDSDAGFMLQAAVAPFFSSLFVLGLSLLFFGSLQALAVSP